MQTTGNGVEGCCEVETSAILNLAMKKSVFYSIIYLGVPLYKKRPNLGEFGCYLICKSYAAQSLDFLLKINCYGDFEYQFTI